MGIDNIIMRIAERRIRESILVISENSKYFTKLAEYRLEIYELKEDFRNKFIKEIIGRFTTSRKLQKIGKEICKEVFDYFDELTVRAIECTPLYEIENRKQYIITEHCIRVYPLITVDLRDGDRVELDIVSNKLYVYRLARAIYAFPQRVLQ